MSSDPPCWYVEGGGQQPAGPFTVEQLTESLQAAQVRASTLCWREGMPEWRRLDQVSPFASAIRLQRRQRKRRIARWVGVCLALALFVAAAAGAGYVWWTESATVGRANKLLAASDHQDAIDVLKPFADTAYLYGNEARYLIAFGLAQQYAVASDSQPSDDGGLQEAKKSLKGLCGAQERWRGRATADLGQLVEEVPKKTSRDLARSARIAGFLEELNLADAKELAKQLLAGLEKLVDSQGDLENLDAAVIADILRRDPSLSVYVVAAVLKDSDGTSSLLSGRLAVIERWAREQPSLAKPLGAALMDETRKFTNTQKTREAELVLDAAEQTDPDLREQSAQMRLGWYRARLTDKDYVGALAGLDGMRLRDYPKAISTEAAGLCLQVAQAASKSDPAVAGKALDSAFAMDPALAQSEANLLSAIELQPEPSAEKLRRCQQLILKFPKSERRTEQQLAILADAVAFSRRAAIGSQNDAERYLKAARTEAETLLEERPTTEKLDRLVWQLAECVAASRRFDDAQDLSQSLLAACPDTPLKEEIEGKITEWQSAPRVGPRVAAPGLMAPAPSQAPSGRHETLEEKLLRRKRTINTSTAVYDAVANKDIWIIEVADTCTAEQFDAEQARLLRDWVSAGGVVWVNSNVLSLFGVRYSSGTFNIFGNMQCVPAGGSHPILEGSKTVLLADVNDKAHTLQYRGVVPLLATGKASGLGNNPAGTTLWSVVPYGSGWISDPKEVDLSNGDGALFWGRFCQFCLHELPWPAPVAVTGAPTGQPAGGPEAPAPQAPPQGPLTGPWEAPEGSRLFIEDDGKSITIRLVRGEALRSFSGTLARRDEDANSKFFDGTCNAVFANAPNQYSTKTTAILNDPDNLRLRFSDWPKWDNRGKVIDKGIENWTLVRSFGGAGAIGTGARVADDPFAGPKPRERGADPGAFPRMPGMPGMGPVADPPRER